jgi:hypothetical protein
MLYTHRLNMELDLQSLFGLHVLIYTHWLRPRNPHPSPRIWAHIRGRYWSDKKDDIFFDPLATQHWDRQLLQTISIL